MNWKKTAWKALKTSAVIILGGVASTIAGPDLAKSLGDAVDAALTAVPFVGGLLSAPIKAALVAGLAVASTAIRNAYKHWNDETES